MKFQNYYKHVKECSCHEELCAKCKEHWGYVIKHLQSNNCPPTHCSLWCVKKDHLASDILVCVLCMHK